ncbi:MAG: hypothetical protein AB7G06_03325 [Bdellovibrionales bacterium]
MTKQFRFRLFAVLFALAIIAVPMVVTYTTSYSIDEMEQQRINLDLAIEAERNAIRVLQAEWAYLAEPARVERLVKAHLKMTKAGASKMALAKDMDKLDAPVMVASATKPAAKKIVVAAVTPGPAPVMSPVKQETKTPEGVQLLLASFKQ